VRTTCQPTSASGKPGVRWPAVIRDASSSGLSLVVARRFEPGASLAVELPGGDTLAPCIVLAKVVRAKAQKDGSWLLGCEFNSALGDEKLGHLSSDTRPEDAADPAPDGTLSSVIFRLETHPGKYLHCVIKRLAVPKSWPLPPGKTLTMRGGFKRLPAQLRVEVVACRRRGERWALWCRLIGGEPAA
jgi:hypothetical protein